jgi:hypothetical protein
MHGRVAVDFGRRGLENTALGKPQHVDGAVHTDRRRLYGVVLVVDGRGWAGQVANLIDLNAERERYVMTDQFEPLLADEVVDVELGAREEVVDTNDLVTVREQAVTKVRAEKASPTLAI